MVKPSPPPGYAHAIIKKEIRFTVFSCFLACDVFYFECKDPGFNLATAP
jgi:hypothetical protein